MLQRDERPAVRFTIWTLLVCAVAVPHGFLQTHGESHSARTTKNVTDHEVIAVLLLRCTVCHGAQRKEANLDLRTRASILKGGKSGPVVKQGSPEESLLVKKIHAGEMPPLRRLVEASIKPIEKHEISTIEEWIRHGLKETPPKNGPTRSDDGRSPPTQHWSFVPPARPTPPEVQSTAHVASPIDAFLLSKLEQQGLRFSPSADPTTLLRRAHFDLIGLPPSINDIKFFKQDYARRGDQAYGDLIDRLLASPHYGERWARYWLDMAGYSDSEGVQHSDAVRASAWRYRDYVINSLNNDKPYDRFLLEQIAGDELADYRNAKTINEEIYDNLTATGFLRMAPDGTWANITNFVPDRLDVISDEIEILSSSIMGLTFKCARCHSHKFDPITQRDYYSLLAIFKGAYDEHNWLKPYTATQFSSGPFGTRQLQFVTTQERDTWSQHESRISNEIKKIEAAIEQHKSQDDAAKFEESSRATIKKLESTRRPEPLVRALWDRGEPSPTFLLKRGNYLTPGEVVDPNVPGFLSSPESPYRVTPPWQGAVTTGRRLAFAQWLINPSHALTARVLVNRVWKHHFGTGIVASLDNFGVTGARPTHPELLDWLAIDFVDRGWSLKKLHRTIMTSRAYQQSSRATDQSHSADPSNQLLSRMSTRRLDAEAVRDSLLFVSGALDSRAGGAPDPVDVHKNGMVTVRDSPTGQRRSIYVQQRRTQVPTLLDGFDFPQMGPNCVERTESTVAPQALHMLNNKVIQEFAAKLSQRARRHEPRDDNQRITWLFLTTQGRSPDLREIETLRKAYHELVTTWQKDGAISKSNDAESKALVTISHALLNSAGFLYVD